MLLARHVQLLSIRLATTAALFRADARRPARRLNGSLKPVVHKSIRFYSAEEYPRSYSEGPAATKYIDLFHKHTSAPIWRLLNVLSNPSSRRRDELFAALQSCSISLDDFERWRPVIFSSDIDAAYSKSQSLGEIPPSWLILYLVSYKVHTPENATGTLLTLVDATLSTSSNIHGPLLILTALSLANFNLLLPLRRIIDTFLTSPNLTSPPPATQFNLFLQALASTPYRSVESANSVVALLRAMDARQLKLDTHTYQALLNDRFVTLQLTKHLHMRMVQEGFVPSAKHLESFLRIFAKNGAIHDAQTYFDIIHATQKGDRDESDPRVRANTLYLNAHDKRNDAFAFLQALTDIDDAADDPSSPPPDVQSPRLVSRSTSDIYDHTAALHVASKDLSTSNTRLIRFFNHIAAQSAPTVATYTVLIQGLIRRGAHAKAEMFWGVLRKSGMILDNAALTAGVEALTRNGKPHEAWQVLEKYALKPGQKQVLQTQPEAHEADLDALFSPDPTPAPPPMTSAQRKRLKRSQFRAEQKLQTAELLVASPPRKKPSHQPPAPLTQPPITLTTISLNEFLVSLNRISRPDITLRLFTHMPTLYPGCLPTAQTLHILLQAARLASKMDDTFIGAVRSRFPGGFGIGFGLGKFGFKLDVDALRALGLDFPKPLAPFRRHKVYDATKKREEAEDDIWSALGDPRRGGLRRYMSGVWMGQTPVEFARTVFLRVVWGMDAEGARLAGQSGPNGDPIKSVLHGVVSPAAAYRSDAEDDGGDGGGALGLGLSFRSHLRPKAYVFQPPADLLTPEGRSFYPSIIPTNASFFNYITLLGCTSLSPQIPLALAWMRALGIQPSTSTLAVALVFWAEVSVPAPLLEGWSWGRETKEAKEYVRLVEWMSDWVGEARMPHWKTLAKWREVVRKMKERREKEEEEEEERYSS